MRAFLHREIFEKNFRLNYMSKIVFLKKDIGGEIKKLPKGPGVYIFQDKNNKPLYIGKASSLRDRVRSYFSSRSGKVLKLLSLSEKIKFIKTDSVLEALFEEANLIKKYQPIFNVREKDNRSFVYLIIPKFKIKDFPSPFIIRGRELGKYPSSDFYAFGPFRSWSILKRALFLLRKIFPYCNKPNSNKPCFYYQIGLCQGACLGKVSKKDYQQMIKNLVLFLKGKKKTVLKNLKKLYPEKIEILKNIEDSILVSKEEITEDFSLTKKLKIESYDISHFAGKDTYGSMAVFENNKPLKESYRIFKIKKARPGDDLSALVEVLQRRIKHKEWIYPNLFLIDGGRNQVNAVYEVVKKLKIPVVGIAKGKEKKDKLILKGAGKNLKKIIFLSKPILQRARDEAHRFAIKFSRKSLSKREWPDKDRKNQNF